MKNWHKRRPQKSTWSGIIHPDCHVRWPASIGDGRCNGGKYNTAECGWDGEDCIDFNEKYPACRVDYPKYIGNGKCNG